MTDRVGDVPGRPFGIGWEPMPDASYLTLRPLGAGTYGEVFLGIRSSDNARYARGFEVEKFAVKKFKLQDRYTVVEASREVRNMLATREAPGQCNRQVVCHVEHFVGTPSGRITIVSRYVEGRTIASMTKKGEKPTALMFRSILRSALEGLRYLHQRNLVHRDIKGDNVMMLGDTALPTVVYLDLGISCKGKDDCNDEDMSNPYRRSPEQWRARGRTPEGNWAEKLSMPEHKASDIWFLAYMLYEWATSFVPYITESAPINVLFAIKMQEAQQAMFLRRDDNDGRRSYYEQSGLAAKVSADQTANNVLTEMFEINWRQRLLPLVGIMAIEKAEVTRKVVTLRH